MNERYLRKLERATEHLSEGGLVEAFELAEQVYRKYPREGYVRMVYGAALWEMHGEWQGLELIESGLRKTPDELFLRNLFTIYMGENLPSYALELATWGEEQGLRVDPDDLQDARELIEDYHQPLAAVKQFDLLKWRLMNGEKVTVDDWRKLLKDYPGFIEARNNMAVTAIHDGELDTALDIVEATLAERPSNFLATGLRWQLLCILKGANALQEVERSWFDTPIESAATHRHLLTTALTLDFWDEALRLAQEVPEGEDEEEYELPSHLLAPLCHAALNLGDETSADAFRVHMHVPEGDPPFPTVPMLLVMPLTLRPTVDKARAYLDRYPEARALLWEWLPTLRALEASRYTALLSSEADALERLKALLLEARGYDHARMGVLMQLVRRGELTLPSQLYFRGELREIPAFARPESEETLELSNKQRRHLEQAISAPDESAERLTRALVRKDPQNPLLELYLAELLGYDFETEREAQEICERVLEKHPRLLKAREQLANLALDRHDYQEAWRHIEALRQEETWPTRDYQSLIEVQLRYALTLDLVEETHLYSKALLSLAGTPSVLAKSMMASILAKREQEREEKRQEPLPDRESLRPWLARQLDTSVEFVADSFFECEVDDLPTKLSDPDELEGLVGTLPPPSQALLEALIAAGGRQKRDALPEHVPASLNRLEDHLLVWVTPDEAVIPPPILRALQQTSEPNHDTPNS